MADRSSPTGAAGRLTATLYRFRRPLLIGWLVALALAGGYGLDLPNRLGGGVWQAVDAESAAAARHVDGSFPGRGASAVALVVRDERTAAPSAAFDARVRRVVDAVIAEPRLGVTGTTGWAAAAADQRSAFVGPDGHTTLTGLELSIDHGTARRVLPEIQRSLADDLSRDGLWLSLVSSDSVWGEMDRFAKAGLARAELLTVPLVLAILLLVYRGVVAALVSLLVSVGGAVFSTAALTVLAGHLDLAVYAQSAAAMLAIAVGVDYSLFLIKRFIEELGEGTDAAAVRAAVAVSLRTSGATVLASGGIVLLAVACLFLVAVDTVRSIALGCVLAVVFAVLTSLLALPVVLLLLGHRINRWQLPGLRGADARSARRWDRLAGFVLARPRRSLAVALLVLGALAAPALHLEVYAPDARIVAGSSPIRQGYDLVADQFGVGTVAPVQVVVTAPRPVSDPAVRQALAALRDRLAGLPHVVRVDSALDLLDSAGGSGSAPAARAVVDRYVSADATTILLEVVPDADPSSETVWRLVADVRAAARTLTGDGFAVAVGGEAAGGLDADEEIMRTLPLVIGLMLIAAYLLLLVTFRSLLLPVKAIAISMLPIAATFGVLVAVFQDRIGLGLLGIGTMGYIQNFIPVLLIALLFSLSTDYEVFLLNRVREEYLATGDNERSVRAGIARTAPLISGAAALMVAVFGSFTLAGNLPIQQLGLGLAVAIALDASLVRLVIVPAAMRLMGRWNWWLPGRPDAALHPPIPSPRSPLGEPHAVAQPASER